VNAAQDLEREKLSVQSRYEKELDELRKRLQDGDADMEKVRVHEQNQRLQLLDEASRMSECARDRWLTFLSALQLNSAQEKIDKLNMQLRARGG
jgi:hypothetical protein